MDALNVLFPAIDDLAGALASAGCDPRAMERGRRVAEASGQRLDAVLL